MALAAQPIALAQGNLRLQTVPTQQRVELFYRDQLVSANIAEFELYSLAADGSRKRLLRGPGFALADVKPAENALNIRGSRDGHDFDLLLTLAGHDTLRMDLQLTAPLGLQLSGIEFDLIYFLADALQGGTAMGGEEVGRARVSIPPQALPETARYLIRDEPRLTLSTGAFYVTVRALQESVPLSFTDLRGVGWDKNRTLLLYSSNRPLMPGRTYRYAYDMQWQLPRAPSRPALLPDTASVTQSMPAEPELHIDPQQRPALPLRGHTIELLPPARKDMALFKRYIDALKNYGVNAVLFYHTPEHLDDLRTGNVASEHWSRQELDEVVRYSRGKGLRILAGMSSKFSAARFGSKSFLPSGSDFYCVDSTTAYDTVFKLYRILIEIYQPEAVHVGHDEIRRLQSCSVSATSSSELLVKDINRLHDWLREHGMGTIMWGDMLLDHALWEGEVGSAHSNHPDYRSGATHLALEHLPKDIVIADWHYSTTRDVRSIDYFKRNGFRVWAVSWYDAPAALRMAESAVRYGAEGIMGSDWGFWRSLSPAAMTPLAWTAGWDLTTSQKVAPAAAVGQLALHLREPVPHGKFSSVPLNAGLNTRRSDAEAFDGKDLFDMGPGLDFSTLPTGRSVWQGVEFAIPQRVPEEAEAVVVDSERSTTATMALPDLQATTLAFLHSMYVSRPNVEPRVMGRYEVVYTDGSVSAVPLVENVNITDLRSGPGVRANPWRFSVGIDELVGAWPGWRGISRTGVPLNTQIFFWRNPRPQQKIEAVRLVAEPAADRCQLVLLALSAAQP